MNGRTAKDAYSLVFPQKIKDWAQRNVSSKDQASYITAYGKSKLVVSIMNQAVVPFWLVNQDARQKALNHQLFLMANARSEKVQTDAANSVLTHTKPPETQKIELDVGVKEGSVIDDLRKATMELVAQQKLQIQSGVANAQEIAHTQIIEGEAEEKTDE